MKKKELEKTKIVQDRKTGTVYVVLPNGDMEQKGAFVGTVAIFKKSWVSENYDDFIELTEKDLHGLVYFGRMPKIHKHEWVDHWDAKTPQMICSKCEETKPKSKIGYMGTSGTEMSDHDY